MAEVTGIHTNNNELLTSIGAIQYDYLVIASGVEANYFGNTGFKDHGLGLNAVTDALAGNLKKLIENSPLEPFTYYDKGSMATIGKKKAVARIGSWSLSGFFAWLIWSGVHLMGIVAVSHAPSAIKLLPKKFHRNFS